MCTMARLAKTRSVSSGRRKFRAQERRRGRFHQDAVNFVRKKKEGERSPSLFLGIVCAPRRMPILLPLLVEPPAQARFTCGLYGREEAPRCLRIRIVVPPPKR